MVGAATALRQSKRANLRKKKQGNSCVEFPCSCINLPTELGLDVDRTNKGVVRRVATDLARTTRSNCTSSRQRASARARPVAQSTSTSTRTGTSTCSSASTLYGVIATALAALTRASAYVIACHVAFPLFKKGLTALILHR